MSGYIYLYVATNVEQGCGKRWLVSHAEAFDNCRHAKWVITKEYMYMFIQTTYKLYYYVFQQ